MWLLLLVEIFVRVSSLSFDKSSEKPTYKMSELPEVWSEERLLGKQVSFKGMPEGGTNGAASLEPPVSPRRRKSKATVPGGLDPMLWGRPGHLTEAEVAVFVSQNRCCCYG